METLIQAHKEENRKKAKVGAIIWLILLMMILIFPFMTIPDPPPEQEGIVVNLGMIDIGDGDQNAPMAEATTASEPTEVEPIESQPEEKPEPDPKPEPQKEEKKKPKKETKKPEPVKVKDTKKVITDNSKELALQKKKAAEAEAARKKAAEKAAQKAAADAEKAAKKAAADAKRAAEAEAARKKAAAEAARKAAEAAKKAEADNLKSGLSGLFGGKGDTGTAGNQGNPDGDPNADALKGISTGAGKVGGGISNRGGKGPKITDQSQATGRVVVKVCVDANGKVLSAAYTQSGSTTNDSTLRRLAEANAKKWTFKAGDLDKSCGTITYDFKVK